MKDPVEEILTAFIALIGTVTGFQVLKDLPVGKIYNYILLEPVIVSDDITGNTWESECSIDIRIVAGGTRHTPRRSLVNAASSTIMQAVTKKPLSMTSFTTGVLPWLRNSFESNYMEGNEIVNQKILTYAFTVKQN
jgi:hypothetical protein